MATVNLTTYEIYATTYEIIKALQLNFPLITKTKEP